MLQLQIIFQWILLKIQKKIRCVNYNESSLLTCFSNDYGYENWVKKAIEFYGDKGDLIILISSSGESKNMLNACKFALKKKTFSYNNADWI